MKVISASTLNCRDNFGSEKKKWLLRLLLRLQRLVPLLLRVLLVPLLLALRVLLLRLRALLLRLPLLREEIIVQRVWLVVGLGNPGGKYSLTRHNIGFMVLDAYCLSVGNPKWKDDHDALVTRLKIDDQEVLLVKPQTFMNNSGEPHRRASRLL